MPANLQMLAKNVRQFSERWGEKNLKLDYLDREAGVKPKEAFKWTLDTLKPIL